jgi:hypothetical protein
MEPVHGHWHKDRIKKAGRMCPSPDSGITRPYDIDKENGWSRGKREEEVPAKLLPGLAPLIPECVLVPGKERQQLSMPCLFSVTGIQEEEVEGRIEGRNDCTHGSGAERVSESGKREWQSVCVCM